MYAKVSLGAFVLLAGLIVASCFASVEKTNNQNLDQSPGGEKQWERIYFPAINERLKNAQIEKLEDVVVPSDSMEIRIWTGFDGSPLRGLILRKQNAQSSAEFLPPSDSSNTAETKPLLLSAQDWDRLWNDLDRTRIMNLNDPMDVAGIDEGTVVIEVKSYDSYKNGKFSGVNSKKGEPYVRVREFCEAISQEFGVDFLKYYRPEPNTK